ncbi:histidinol-phosphate transaminase [Corynebacterium liangguodongii]|uniref:Histidinol-phosphate aminotransferase n=1 Tax=Corynebacterium liangguodongii TaxID=2079535 RepID=A0A2S0WGS5_9CORY|nr:histidinol-phosphate transaminase [Corynebacterium liangguodongii]AWB84975.1 histidinol-phosphate transaminase [Corynebacterium liangguodongii]PWB98811.1 histidinol-phosphate transaminase [Corynebacterium liangguodongii]
MIRPDIASIPPYAPGKAFPDAVKLSSNESAEGPLEEAAEAMAAAAAGANRYPDMFAVELRETLAAHLGVEACEVAVGNGSSALLQQLVQATCTAENNVIYAWRSFEAYPIFLQVVGAKPRPVPIDRDGRHDLDAMAALIDEATSLIFVCTPNNPSGQVITNAEFDAFMAKVPPRVTVALDEAYFEYNRDEDAVVGTEAIRRYPNVVALRTFSKAYGLAGVRVGYAFGRRELIDALSKVAIPFQVSSVAQAGAIASLGAPESLAQRTGETIAVRDEVADRIGAARSEANFVWLPGVDAASISERLAAEGVVVRAFPEGLRVTVTNREEAEQFLRAWDAIHS